MIGKFAYSLNQSADLDGLQIAEALWLSRYLTLPGPENSGEKMAETVAPDTPAPAANQTPANDDRPVSPAQSPRQSPPSVYAGAQEAGAAGAVAASKIRAPGVAALAEALEISRALRPFTRRTESHYRLMLDEAATVELSAELSHGDRPIILPVLKPAKDRWFEVAVVVEDTPSMAVWRSTVDELVLLLGNHGAFRDVRLWRLAFRDDAPRLFSKSGAELEPNALNDASSRRLTLLVSDCVSRQWRDGGMARLIANWSATMPVVIGQMLGQRLWRRTALGEPTAEVKATRPGAVNKDLTIANVKWWDRTETRAEESAAAPGSPASDGNRIACPVISLDPKQIAGWARMVMSPGRRHPAALLSPDAPPVEPAAQPGGQPPSISAETRLERYRMMVSPEAYRLAINLSFLPLTLPVMRVAQRAAMPDTGHEALSEFLLGGLLKRKDPAATQTDHDLVQYEFHADVRDLLRSELQPDEVRKLLPCISDFIGRRVHSIYDFIAWAEDAQGEHQVQPDDLPFAEIGLDGLEQMGYPRRTMIKEVATSGTPASGTAHQADPASSAGSGAITIGKIQQLSGWPAKLDTALQGKLGIAEAAQFANQLRGMTAIEVSTLMREAGIERLGERLRLMVGGAEIGAYLANDATREIHDLLLEADRRCQVVKSPEAIKKVIPLRGLNSRLIAETERVNQLVRETAAGTRSSSLTMTTGDQRTATLRTALDLYAEFPDGVLIVEANRQPITHYEAMLACAQPFVELGENLTAKNELLLISRFMESLGDRRRLIILDQIPNAAEMGFIPHLPPGCALVIVESRAVEPKPTRDALESQLRQLRAEYGDVVARLRQAGKETDLRRLPAPVMLENWKAQRKTLLQDIRKLEAQIAALNRDPQWTLDELMEWAKQGLNQSGNGPIETFIRDFRQLESEGDFDPGQSAALMNIALEYLRLDDPATAAEFCQFALERTGGDLRLDYNICLVLAQALTAQQEFERAERVLRQALESAEAAEDTLGQARANSDLGDLLLQANDPRGAQERYKDALAQFRIAKSVREELHVLVKLAEAAAAAGEQTLARKFAEQALEILNNLELPDADRLRQTLERLRTQPNFSSFSYETLTLDQQGEEVKDSRRTLSARQFTEELSDGVNLEMVEIPGGTFTMGSPESEAERLDRETQHEVTVSPFYIGKFTITQAQWRTVAGWPKVERDLEPAPSRFKDKPDSDLRPVERVSWEDAKEFCARLSQKTGRAYRLPTEAEWEYACRAGTTTPFAFGETITHEIANYDSEYPYAKAKKQKSRGETVPVGTLPSTKAPVANAFGLYDMHGNVWEWCEDWYGDYPSEPQTDPTGPETGQYRVLRGGSWISNGRICRSAYRFYYDPLYRYNVMGLRVVCVSARTS